VFTRIVASSTFVHSGTNGFIGYSIGLPAATSTLTLSQVVTIPIGVTVKVGVWFKALRPVHSTTSPFTVTLTVDNIQVTTWNPNSNVYAEIVPISNNFLGTATQSSHTLSLTVQSQIDTNQVVFAADDFYVTPILGPNGETICSAPWTPLWDF
jgi:hypothetical protein